MDAIQALKTLRKFRSKTGNSPAGVVMESPEARNKTFWAHFRVGFYHVMIQMSVGIRGGVLEDNIVVDTRPKASEVESLVCANFGLRPMLFMGGGEQSFVAFSIRKTRGMRKEDVASKVRSALDNFVQSVATDPKIATTRITEIISYAPGTSLGASRYTMTRA